jgi:VWFA-related protein
MSRPSVLAVFCLVVLLGLIISAQQLPPAQAPVFRGSVDFVHLDVSVLDKNRVPVRGLTQADFTVLEDGRPQAIVAFSAVDVPDAEPPAAPWMRTVTPDVQSNVGAQDPEGRLFVLLLDDAMIPPHPASLKTAREVAKKFLDRVTTADRVAIVFSASGRNQTFTNDRAKLDRAVETLDDGYANHLQGWDTARTPNDRGPCELDPFGPKFDEDATYRSASLQTLRQVAETLISAPQRRKVLIYISPGPEVDILGAAAPLNTAVEKCTRVAVKEQHLQAVRQLPELFLRMRRANVTIYPVDPSGFGGFEAYILGKASSVPSLRMQSEQLPAGFDWFNPGAHWPTPEDLTKHISSLSMDFLQMAAANTGGKAVVNTNDFDTAIDRIFLENSSYYLIGYQQPDHKPGSLHSTKVTVNRDNVEVRTRSGYAVEDAPKSGKSGAVTTVSPLDAVIAGAVPDGTVPMRAVFAPILLPGKKNPVVTVVVGLEQPPVAKRTIFTVDLQTNAYTPDGRPRFIGQQHKATVVLAPTSGKDRARYDLLSELSLPPGRYELRLSAHSGLDNTNGSLYADLEVPDFAKAPLSVSGLIVEANPSDATAPPGAFDKYLPVVPTSNREFRKTQEVTAFMRIYQGQPDKAPAKPASPVAVATRLIDRSEKVIGEGVDTIAPAEFRVGGRAADYRFPVPLSILPPGPYLLTLTVTLDKTVVTRSLQFTVLK